LFTAHYFATYYYHALSAEFHGFTDTHCGKVFRLSPAFLALIDFCIEYLVGCLFFFYFMCVAYTTAPKCMFYIIVSYFYRII